MKMMDISGQDDCCIEAVTPAKKKKMKQAQLPFQMQSPVQSQNVTQSKKRKLTSPSTESKVVKAVKILKKSSAKDIVTSNVNNDVSDTKNNSPEVLEVIDDTETEDAKENTRSNEVEAKRGNETTKDTSTGQKKLENQEKSKSKPLTKFLQKIEKHEESLKEDTQEIEREVKGKSLESSLEAESNLKQPESMHSLSNKMEEPSVADNSLCQSDSDVAILSSDNEDKEDDSRYGSGVQKNITGSPQTPKATSGDMLKHKKLTPKQQEKRILSAKRKEERQRLKMEKERKLEEERENRRREKEEKRREKEERDRAEREQRMMEKKMKEQKKQMEIEQKQKEKQAKEEERRKREEAKEEERRKKEEEKLEAERKKQKAASNFTSFFVAKKQEKSIDEEGATQGKNFMPFEVKSDMKVAPVCRRSLNEQEKSSMDEKCNEGNAKVSDLYISELRDKRRVPRKSSKTWPLEAKDDIVLLDDENDDNSNIVSQHIVVEKQRPKLLQFSENQRPPYWGTWRKQSSHVNPRRPFSKDTKWFNYEVDSDEEWEEEEPGESLRGSDDEKDEENPEDNEYDVDNEFMVPHGYLSDEEVRADEEDKEDMSPETQKYKLKVLGEQFETERKTKTSKLKPKIIGCIWRGADNKFAPNVPERTVAFLSAHEAWVREFPVLLPTATENEVAAGNESFAAAQQQGATSSKKTRVPEVALPDLIRLLHGNTHGRRFLVREFMIYWNKKDKKGENRISKASLLQKIREIGQWRPCPEEGPMQMKSCWYVPEEIRRKYTDEELPLPNRWCYSLTPKRKRDHSDAPEKPDKEDKEKEKDKEREKKSVPLITQFTKKITQEEMKKQLTVRPTVQMAPATNKSARPPKRATLISVGRGEQFSKASKDSLLKSFVAVEKKEETEVQSNDDVIILSSPEREKNEDEREDVEDSSTKENVDSDDIRKESVHTSMEVDD